jgi:nicotinamidase/pyrazinamidase
VAHKGTDPGIDSYSAFFDNGHQKDTGLAEFCRTHGVSELVVCGLATDYCVKFTVLDALGLGFGVTVIEDGCRAVELQPGDGARAIDEMRSAGALVTTSESFV